MFQGIGRLDNGGITADLLIVVEISEIDFHTYSSYLINIKNIQIEPTYR